MQKWIDEKNELEKIEKQLLEQLQRLQLRKAYIQGAIDALNEREILTNGNTQVPS